VSVVSNTFPATDGSLRAKHKRLKGKRIFTTG